MTGATGTLVIGYGNPGRMDDGLGPALASRIARMGLEGVTTMADYQLTVEMAEVVSRSCLVIFADAASKGCEPFSFSEISLVAPAAWDNHRLEPSALLRIASALFGSAPSAYMLAIRGYKFDEFDERLSAKAESNLEQAAKWLEATLRPASNVELI